MMKSPRIYFPLFVAIATGLVGSLAFIGISLLNKPVLSEHSIAQAEPDLDNIYHEDENLPDDADVFPRMGKILGSSGEMSNCRAQPWGEIVKVLPGNVFVEIDNRTVARDGESWFHSPDNRCWIHDSRIDLL
ncbi:MAG: hypothetical protein RID09_15995 [Coleofasciculus sp. G1-WW12-02]|uniref:hypothetical protein n=1 Tax=Coleofasciculus sp. G1-WW12-02 TaxID=3068483 RepID=UPI0032F888E0